jgi:protein KTI12
MPALILTGNGCTGKTTFATLFSQRAKKHKSGLIKNVVIINEESARPDKTLYECYATSTEEKLTRSALKSEFDKYVVGDKKTLVILDSLNYIKGFRYELHCISKAVGEKHGIIWLLCDEEVAKKWNEKRINGGQKPKGYFYSEEMMDELMLRYEPPDQRNRWDRPLYRVDVHSTLSDSLLDELKISKKSGSNENGDDETGRAAENILSKSVYNMHSLSDAIKDSTQSTTVTSNKKIGTSFRRAATAGSGFRRATKNNTETDEPSSTKAENENEKIAPPKKTENVKVDSKRQVKKMEDLIDAILDSYLLDVEPLKAGQSTTLATAASSNVLHDVDSVSQDISTAFLNAQKNSSIGNGGKVIVPIGKGKTFSIQINKTVQVVEMKRLRRQYVRWVKDHPPKDTSQVGIAASFLSFLENQL